MKQEEKLALELRSLFDLHLELPEACREAESRIAEGIPKVVEAVIGTEERSGMIHDGIRFEVRVREVAGDASALVISIGEAATRWDADAFARVPVDLSGSGMYITVTVEADERLGAKLDRVATAVQQLSTGWLPADGNARGG